MKTIEEINQHNVKQILSEKKIPDFYPGDVVKVGVRITEGKKERIQYFEGVCVAKTCSTSEVPIPNAKEPKAPCVAV
ncbi:50S ribosomal protein L19 [Candidatus Pelagibacter sp.]|nr:50S ribosomal protein L19 [Candidatus Pelagibacter sp.]